VRPPGGYHPAALAAHPGPAANPGRPTHPGPAGRPGGVGVPGPEQSPWTALPSGLAPLLRPRAGKLAHAIVREIQRRIPEYSRPLEGDFGQVITDGVEQAVLHFIDQIADPSAPQDERAEIYRKLGRIEVHEARGVEPLQAAFRLGARVAWRYLTEASQQLRFSVPIIGLLGEALFAHIDELTTLSMEGYAAAQARAAGGMERRRRRLLELILSEPPVVPGAIRDAAESVGWPVPDWVCMVALHHRDGEDRPLALELDGTVLVDLESDEPCLLMPCDPAPAADPDGLPPVLDEVGGTRPGHPDSAPDALTGELLRVVELEKALDGWKAAIGPPVRLADAARSLTWARRTLALADRGLIDPAPVISCSRNLSTLWLLADQPLVEQLAAQTLRPFGDLTAKQRARLRETLLAWLKTRDSAPTLAATLGVHPQTIRYRMHQLERLFGGSLVEPDSRFDLEVALRAWHLLEPDNLDRLLDPA
jgi:hypothetical protein